MDSRNHWNEFMKSGRISDYLLYRQALAAETALEFGAENADADENRRDRDPGKSDART